MALEKGKSVNLRMSAESSHMSLCVARVFEHFSSEKLTLSAEVDLLGRMRDIFKNGEMRPERQILKDEPEIMLG